MFLSLFSLLTAPLAMAEESPEEGTQISADRRSAADELESAIADYLNGDLESARLALLRLAYDPRLAENPALKRRVQVYLGEVLYVMGDRETSWEVFTSVVRTDPDYQMDPFVHPPDVVTYFESARDYTKRFNGDIDGTTTTPDPLLPPLPWALLPGRIQFFNEQPVLGYLTIGGVTLGTGAAFGISAYLRAQDVSPNTPGINVAKSQSGDIPRLQTIKDLRDATAVATAGIWAAAVLQGTLRSSRAPQLVSDEVSLSGSVSGVEHGDGAVAFLTVTW